jgi:hypothetical protein
VYRLLGEPTSIAEFDNGTFVWTYREIVLDPVTKKLDPKTDVNFSKDERALSVR